LRFDTDDDTPHEEFSADADEAGQNSEAEVVCPYCGETVELAIDPHGGHAQEYIEDCPVCCRPWRVQVSFDDEGKLEVSLEKSE